VSRHTLIAIIDDDESVREATKSLIRSFGFAAESFGSAEEFLKSDCLERTRCLITDVQMPGKSGLDLYRQLVAAGKTIPTILITAYPDEKMHARALKAGVICYLIKPFDEQQLIACIRSVVGEGPRSWPCHTYVAKIRSNSPTRPAPHGR
jgi:FixJ family two-component response regulator